jgi:hypothetical protein
VEKVVSELPPYQQTALANHLAGDVRPEQSA